MIGHSRHDADSRRLLVVVTAVDEVLVDVLSEVDALANDIRQACAGVEA